MVDGQTLKKPADNLDNDRNDDTEDDHGRYGKIKPEILPLYADVPGQTANPVQAVMKKINEQTDNNDQHPCRNDPFACFIVHLVKLSFNQGSSPGSGCEGCNWVVFDFSSKNDFLLRLPGGR